VQNKECPGWGEYGATCPTKAAKFHEKEIEVLLERDIQNWLAEKEDHDKKEKERYQRELKEKSKQRSSELSKKIADEAERRKLIAEMKLKKEDVPNPDPYFEAVREFQNMKRKLCAVRNLKLVPRFELNTVAILSSKHHLSNRLLHRLKQRKSPRSARGNLLWNCSTDTQHISLGLIRKLSAEPTSLWSNTPKKQRDRRPYALT
jgi:hypothetical protein